MFPSEIRPLVGAEKGVLLAQQTAANLHAAPGCTVTIERMGVPPVSVKIDGVVDLPNADSLFQAVGAPSTAAPQAPPDNVVIMPLVLWHQLFDPQASVRPDSVRLQIHVRLIHHLSPSPAAAYIQVEGLAHNLEARIAGSAVVGNNLAARLGGVREDSLYAQVLFLFLGLPGAMLAALLTLAVAASGQDRRRSEQALLRTRGASTVQVLQLESLEAVLVACGGLLLAAVLTYSSTGALTSVFMDGSHNWLLAAEAVGFALAVIAMLLPAWMDARQYTVTAGRLPILRPRQPLWQKIWVDVILLAISGLVFWQGATTGYQVVLAPEGVAQTSVSYQIFIAPVCLWLGAVLLTIRLWGSALRSQRCPIAILIKPVTGNLSGVVSSSLARQEALITRGTALVTLALAFAVSTAIFNTTYNAQSRVDAQLTNGADVTVAAPTASPPSSKIDQLRQIPGAAAVELMQHRFAYVGNDLQDIYGIDPASIGAATNMSNAFFGNGNARSTLEAMAHHRDGVLVSEETVRDFQLNPGDQLNLRLQSATDHIYHVVPFHLIGIVREFPTAPKDSFLVVNASYIAQATGSNAAEVALIRAPANPAQVARRARAIVRGLSGARVTEIGTAQRTIASSLTAINLHGLTRLELAYAVLLVAGSTGLVLLLAMTERRRSFAVLAALGADMRQLGAFQWSEGLVILLGGAVFGTALGVGLAEMLVKLLTGVFDPPPEALAMPWAYLAILAVAAVGATVLALRAAQAVSRRDIIDALREL
jgi:putative ABC transport system permease protein